MISHYETNYHGPERSNSAWFACSIQYSLVEYGTEFTVKPVELRKGSCKGCELMKGTCRPCENTMATSDASRATRKIFILDGVECVLLVVSMLSDGFSLIHSGDLSVML